MSELPDVLAGLADAQVRLRAKTGEDVEFFWSTGETWPPNVNLDPETGRPFDPSVEPIASGVASGVARCNVAFRPVQGLNDSADETAIGNIQRADVVLITSVESWEDIKQATTFHAKGDRFKITQYHADGIGSNYRQLIWGERIGPL